LYAKEKVELLLKRASAAAQLAAAAKPQRPTGGGGGGTPKGFDALNAAILAAKLDPKNPAKQAAAQAAIEAADRWGKVQGTETTATKQDALDITRIKSIEEAKTKAIRALRTDIAWGEASPAERKRMEADAEQRAEQAFRRMQRTGAPGAAPAAGAGTRLKFGANGNLIQ